MLKRFLSIFSVIIITNYKCLSIADIELINDDSGKTIVCQAKLSPKLSFAMERIDLKGYCKWETDFVKPAKQLIGEMKISSKAASLKDACDRFADFLKTFFRYRDKGINLWVSYAFNKDDVNDLDTDNPNWIQDIEMVFSVLSYPDDPFTVHMGIFRNPQYKGKKHKNLSIPLHAFAAESVSKIYPNKICMITRPQSFMRDIFDKELRNYPSEKQFDLIVDPKKNQFTLEEKFEKIFDGRNSIENYKWYLDIDAKDFIVDLEQLKAFWKNF